MKTQFPSASCHPDSANAIPRRGKLAAIAAASLVGAMPMARAAIIATDTINVGPGELVAGGGLGETSQLGLVLETGTLTIAPTGKLNLKDNALIVRTGNFSTIYGYVVTGYDGGTWNGYGISSSTAAADPTHLAALGIISNAEAHYATFEGRSTPLGTETFVKYSLYGDANLDGLVDGTDLALMASGTGWYHGDFNYSGTVDAVDYALFEAGRASQTGNVPEPGSLSLLMAGVAGLAGRRRSRN